MRVHINDVMHELNDGSCIPTALETAGIKPENVAVAVNFSVVPKDNWDSFTLNENDKVMIIRATQGG